MLEYTKLAFDLVDEKIKQEIQGFWRRVYENKTPMCKHQRGCIYNVVQGAIKSFCLGVGTKYLINLLLGLLRPKTLMANLFSLRSLLDAGRFTLFVVLFNISYKIVLCSLRRATKNEKLSSIVAGGKSFTQNQIFVQIFEKKSLNQSSFSNQIESTDNEISGNKRKNKNGVRFNDTKKKI